MRVLLIEDDSATAQTIQLMLKSENLNVFTTDLGEEGVDLGKIYDYDIILLDLNLPDMSGFEVLRKLRVARVKTPIIIVSGLAGIEDKVARSGFWSGRLRYQALSQGRTHRAHPSGLVPSVSRTRPVYRADRGSGGQPRRKNSTDQRIAGSTHRQGVPDAWKSLVCARAPR